MKVYGSTVRYVQTDPRALIDEEDLLDDIAGAILNLVDDYGLTVDEAADECIAYHTDLVEQARKEIKSGAVKSVYEMHYER